MPATAGDQAGLQAGAAKREVSYRVEELVADELIRPAQSAWVQHQGAVNHHRIVQTAAARKPRLAQRA